MKLKFSVNKKIKNSREEEKVLERLGQSDFANTQRILLLLRSRAEFRSRSSLSIDEELDWIFYNESSDVGNGGAMDAIGTSDLEMINNLNQNILLSNLLDLLMVENGQMENVSGQSGASTTSGFQETVTQPLPHIYISLFCIVFFQKSTTFFHYYYDDSNCHVCRDYYCYLHRSPFFHSKLARCYSQNVTEDQ